MELNTPNKNKQLIPLSQFEDSPIFNYINNLSPFELVKSVHVSTDQTFNSLSLSSPPSVFASPKFISQRDTKSFSIKRRHFLDAVKPESLKSRDETNANEGVSETDDQLGYFNANTSANEGNDAEQNNDHLRLTIQLPNVLDKDTANLDRNIVAIDAISTDNVPGKLDKPIELHCSYESEKHLRNICRIEQGEDEAGGDWVTSISNVADMLYFDSSIVEEQHEEPKMVDPGTISFVSNVLQIPQDNINDLESLESTDCVGSLEQKVGESVTQSKELITKKDADKIPVLLSSSVNKAVVSDAVTSADVKGKKRQSSSKQQNRIRRLVFEMAGVHKKKSISICDGTSPVSPQPDFEVASIEKYSTPRISIISKKGIGLHLNALTATSVDDMAVKNVTSSSTNRETLDTDMVLCDNQDNVLENASQMLMGGDEDISINSPKTKRLKLEHVGASCKRCNCKRSKCLKLYCDCFAAGLYCIEPCSCQDCFNKPAHEDIVLQTRKQIESRNPLAFAPKVIRTADYVSELAVRNPPIAILLTIEDDTNKTPASSRHKRGCNCKKSNCLKKYCECFQSGVGCSLNCRCEGCKNTFGCKNGHEENELEEAELEALEYNKEAEKEHADLSRPSETARSSIQLPMAFSGLLSKSLSAVGASTQMCTSQKLGTDVFRLPKSEKQLQAIPEEETPEILTGNCSPKSSVKSVSPNCKRVSPPHHGFGALATWRSSRKLILRSVPPMPSLNSPNQQQ
ncbi:CRC domain-containing protein TSO1 isoform X2 [Mercurialis annua]|uniref:CRC domain-containing protein TSO1 isoform X2 n=1 Tax=Mercurialis annua TaxID=3986 RepID=UPI0024AE2B80|nr:CRC domain-containing protein TSO1 isoform X2 [Mercurialis annua]